MSTLISSSPSLERNYMSEEINNKEIMSQQKEEITVDYRPEI